MSTSSETHPTSPDTQLITVPIEGTIPEATRRELDKAVEDASTTADAVAAALVEAARLAHVEGISYLIRQLGRASTFIGATLHSLASAGGEVELRYLQGTDLDPYRDVRW